MANGTYGTKRPAQVTAEDVDIFYHYRPSYSSDDANFTEFKQLDSGILTQASGSYSDTTVLNLPGMYNLRLPLNEFSKVGVYTVYIKPKEIFTVIEDGDARLAAYSDIRGILINAEGLGELANNGNLVGYRIEYFDNDTMRNGEYRIVTSNNRCEPVQQNFNDSSQNGVRYRFNDSSNHIFVTLSPSSSLSFKSNSEPSIGITGQKIAIVNTKFNPVAVEVEIVDHDIDSLTTMLEGSQLRNLDAGIITTFDDDGGIYHQAQYGRITNPANGIHHDFKFKKNTNINYEELNKINDIKQVIKSQ